MRAGRQKSVAFPDDNLLISQILRECDAGSRNLGCALLTIPSLFENCLSPQPPLTPVYFAAALVLHRGAEVTRCEPDMAMVHHLLSKIPDELVSITSFFYVELLIQRSFLPFHFSPSRRS